MQTTLLGPMISLKTMEFTAARKKWLVYEQLDKQI
jgi:hypothetical protein